MSKQKVILIEDDEVLSVVMQEELGRVGFDVDVADSGEKGLKLARSKKPALVLLDLMLPDISGFDVLAKLKADQKTKKIPVVILTSMSMDENIRKAIDAGADDYMVKSQHTVTELVEMIQEFLVSGGVKQNQEKKQMMK